MIRVLMIIFLLSKPGLNAMDSGCTNCSCCKDGLCGRQFIYGRIIDQYCTHGCILGFGGLRCYEKCPDDCLTCEQYTPKNCVNCTVGKYLVSTTKDKRCVDCPSNCKQCTSATKCQECYHPYYNDERASNCSLSCPRNCVCESIGVCSSCQQGYSGDTCCLKDGHCLHCSTSSVCEVCASDYYGEQCDKRCPRSCHITGKRSQCERVSGICLRCGDGFHGDYCTRNCSRRCINRRCHKDYGYCTEGCIDGFEGSTCSDKTSQDKFGIVSVVLVVAATIIVVVTIIAAQRWTRNQLQKFMEPINNIHYVKSQAQSATIDTESVFVKKADKSTVNPRFAINSISGPINYNNHSF